MQIEKYSCRNLELITLPSDLPEAIHFDVYFRHGAASDPSGQKGAAHVLEHVLIGCLLQKIHRNNRLLGRVQWRGTAYCDAKTSFDYTHFAFRLPTKHYSAFVDFYLPALFHHTFDSEAVFSKSKAEVFIERALKCRYEQLGYLYETLYAAAYHKEHPYHCFYIGKEQDILKLSFEDMKQRYYSDYLTDKITMVITGDLPSNLKIVKLTNLFASKRSAKRRIEREALGTHARTGRSVKRVNIYGDISTNRMLLGLKSPPFGHDHRIPLMILNLALFHPTSPYCVKRARNNIKYVIGYLSKTALGGLHEIFVHLSDRRSNGIETSICEQVFKFLSHCKKASSLYVSMKKLFLKETQILEHKPDLLADALGLQELFGGDASFERLPEKVAALTVESFSEVIENHLSAENLTIVTESPSHKIKKKDANRRFISDDALKSIKFPMDYFNYARNS